VEEIWRNSDPLKKEILKGTFISAPRHSA